MQFLTESIIKPNLILWLMGRVVACFEDEGGHLRRSTGGLQKRKNRSWLTASKETGTSNLRLQVTRLCQQPE